MKTTPLHLVEPTLFDNTGHSLGYVSTLVNANKEQDMGFDFHVWLDKRGQNLLNDLALTPHPVFSRQWRRLQKAWLFKKLLKSPGKIFISTCEHIDLIFLDWLAPTGKKRLENKIYCHFHQYTVKQKKLAQLKKIANNHPEFIILATTEGLIDIFREAGFRKTQVIPCPTMPRSNLLTHNIPPIFSKVIYAGAARADKGFAEVVNLVTYLKQSGSRLPFEIQISPPHTQRYDRQSEIALRKLQQIPKDNLTLHPHSLSQQQYQALFEQSICLLLYDPKIYADKFSGVALDAFYAGCPVIAPQHTWMGQVTETYQAGEVLSNYAPNQVAKVVEKIKANYSTYQENARQAAIQLMEIHHPKHTLNVFTAESNQIDK